MGDPDRQAVAIRVMTMMLRSPGRSGCGGPGARLQVGPPSRRKGTCLREPPNQASESPGTAAGAGRPEGTVSVAMIMMDSDSLSLGPAGPQKL